jgi:UDP-N-acetylglucosamine 4,6-dehydratase
MIDENMFLEKKILITGGSGSWGNELTKQLLEKDPKEIIIYSRGELAQVNMERKFRNPKLKFVIGDVRDYETLRRTLKGVDYVYHLSALKHVPVCENQPQEAIKTNIDGTTNIINAAIENGVKNVVDVSTDKACLPINLYGMTKAIGEKLIIQANNLSSTTKFSCVRGGNVLGSNGSVVPFFIDQIKKFNKVTITDSRMTRYFLTLSEAIHLLFKATEHSIGGETFVMNMPSFFISDLAKVLIEHYGNKDTKVEEIGIREGEKLHEMLVSEHESPNTYAFDEDYYSILPSIKMETMEAILNYYKYKNIKKVDFKEFTSEDNLKGKIILKEFLKKGGFLV